MRLAAVVAKVLPDRLRISLYRLGPLSGWIRHTLSRASPRGMTTVAVASGPLEGARFSLNLQQEKDLWLGTYELRLQREIQRRVVPGMVAYDLGANLGYLTVLLARCVGKVGQVYAFEPLPANLTRLERSLELNGLQGRVRVVPAAVAERRGRQRFMVHNSGGMGKLRGSGGREVEYLQDIEVETVNLDGYLENSNHPAPDVIKMDLEGGEVMALPGMRETLRRYQPELFLELHGEIAAVEAWTLLTDQGYRLYSLELGRILDPKHIPWKAYVLALTGER